MSLPKLLIPGRPVWQQTMLRIRDPIKSLEFYRDILGMSLIDKFDFPQYQFSLYFLTTLPQDEKYDLIPGTQEAHDYLWSMDRVTLELTHNHGTEKIADLYHPGNEEKDGFGHVAFNCEDIYKATDLLLEKGVSFQKKPNEGRMPGIAFAKDPDGYWVELLNRSSVVSSQIKNKFNFSQTMLRVKDMDKSISFYESFGLKVLRKKNYGNFTNAFMGMEDELKLPSVSLPSEDPMNRDMNDWTDDDFKEMLRRRFLPVLELTHNHGTETDDDFKHYNGNESGRQGFGHIGFLVDDVYKACDAIRTLGYGFRKEPDGGSMKGLAFAYDPDGYSVEIIKRGGIDFGDVKKVVSKTD